MKILRKLLLLLFFPLGILYLWLLRCQRRPWPEGLKEHHWFAHRGLHHQPDAPENSLAAFRAALENGFGAELDVHLMKDGHLAVIHDSSLLRTAGVDVRIEDLCAEDLKDYRLEGSEEKVPLLEEVLNLFEGKTPLIIELKVVNKNHKELTAAVCRLLDRYSVNYCIESFDPRVLYWLKKNRPEIIRGQLSCDMREEGNYHPLGLWALTHLLSSGFTRPDFIAYDYKTRKKFPELTICRRLYGVQEASWTLRDADTAGKLRRKGNLIIFEGFMPETEEK